MTIDDILSLAPVIPVLTLDDAGHAAPLARALVSGGLPVIEVTLRTEAGLRAIEAVARQVPEAVVGAGTVTAAQDLTRAAAAGARFAVSPGTSPALLEAGAAAPIPYLPGVMTPSEMMAAWAAGYRTVKFYPAAPAGGVAALKAHGAVFPEMRFCPTGGITSETCGDYLALANVIAVGGSWPAPAAAVAAADWDAIARNARRAAGIRAAQG